MLAQGGTECDLQEPGIPVTVISRGTRRFANLAVEKIQHEEGGTDGDSSTARDRRHYGRPFEMLSRG